MRMIPCNVFKLLFFITTFLFDFLHIAYVLKIDHHAAKLIMDSNGNELGTNPKRVSLVSHLLLKYKSGLGGDCFLEILSEGNYNVLITLYANMVYGITSF